MRVTTPLVILGVAACSASGMVGNGDDESSSAVGGSDSTEGDDPTSRDLGMSTTLRVHVAEQFAPNIVHIAGLFLEMEVVEVDEDADAHIVLRHWDEAAPGLEGNAGYTLCDTEECCRSRVWSINSRLALAHELGHALGLHDVEDPKNIMYPEVEAGLITDEQFLTMRRHAWKLENTCE